MAASPLTDEHRHSRRVAAAGLMALVDGTMVRVLDVSEGGMKVERHLPPLERKVLPFTLYRCAGTKLDLNGGVAGKARVVWARGGVSGLAFAPPTMALMKLIIRHASEALGAAAYIVK